MSTYLLKDHFLYSFQVVQISTIRFDDYVVELQVLFTYATKRLLVLILRHSKIDVYAYVMYWYVLGYYG